MNELLEALDAIEKEAKRAQLRLAAGMMTNGVSSLRKLELMARDARRHALERHGVNA